MVQEDTNCIQALTQDARVIFEVVKAQSADPVPAECVLLQDLLAPFHALGIGLNWTPKMVGSPRLYANPTPGQSVCAGCHRGKCHAHVLFVAALNVAATRMGDPGGWRRWGVQLPWQCATYDDNVSLGCPSWIRYPHMQRMIVIYLRSHVHANALWFSTQ